MAESSSSSSSSSSAKEEAKRLLRKLDWRDLTFIGVEVGSIPSIYKDKFTFPELKKALKDGELSNLGHPMYMFMGAQPIEYGGRTLNIPYIVVIDSEAPPPSRIAHCSIQGQNESIIDMKNVRMGWVPYVPKKFPQSLIKDKLPIQIYTLNWYGRTAKSSKLTEDRARWLEYLIPYIRLPQMVESIPEPKDTDVKNVNFTWKYQDKKYEVVYDKEMDTLPEFIPTFLEDNKLPESAGPELKQALKDAFQKAREQARADYQSLQDEVNKLPDRAKQAYRNIKLYKFYPTHPDINIRRYIDKKINRYFGSATRVFPEPEKDVALENFLERVHAEKRKLEDGALSESEKAPRMEEPKESVENMTPAPNNEDKNKEKQEENQQQEEEDEGKEKAPKKQKATRGRRKKRT
jgi:hypothetical protein